MTSQSIRQEMRANLQIVQSCAKLAIAAIDKEDFDFSYMQAILDTLQIYGILAEKNNTSAYDIQK